MKTFEGDNHYDILQVKPDAGKDAIRHAYRQARDIYDADSMATYALFSEAKRKTLLAAIETAFATLIDDGKRAAYDQMLIDTGELHADAFSRRTRRMAADGPDSGPTTQEENIRRWVSKRAKEPEMCQRIETIQSAQRFSGPQLKALRNAFGIELSDIYTLTRINRDVMRAIEGDRFEDLPAMVYLKQFLKDYAEILQIDPLCVIEHYMAAMAGDDSER